VESALGRILHYWWPQDPPPTEQRLALRPIASSISTGLDGTAWRLETCLWRGQCRRRLLRRTQPLRRE